MCDRLGRLLIEDEEREVVHAQRPERVLVVRTDPEVLPVS